jgi:hypothetical protein
MKTSRRPTNSTPGSSNWRRNLPPAQKYFGDTVLTHQNGEKLKLYEDLMKGKVVVVSSFFSSCYPIESKPTAVDERPKGICSVLLPKLAALQAMAGDRLG